MLRTSRGWRFNFNFILGILGLFSSLTPCVVSFVTGISFFFFNQQVRSSPVFPDVGVVVLMTTWSYSVDCHQCVSRNSLDDPTPLVISYGNLLVCNWKESTRHAMGKLCPVRSPTRSLVFFPVYQYIGVHVGKPCSTLLSHFRTIKKMKTFISTFGLAKRNPIACEESKIKLTRRKTKTCSISLFVRIATR